MNRMWSNSQSAWINIYSVQESPPSGLLFVLAGVALVVITLVLNRRKEFSRDPFGETIVRRGTPGTRRAVWFACAWTLLASLLTLGAHWSLREDMASGQYVEVSGQVEQYLAADLLRKTPERWSVGGHQYEIFDAQRQAGFDSPGLVRPGLYVRIWDVGGRIVRLDTAQR